MTALEPGLSTLASSLSTVLAAGEWKYWLPPQNSTHGDDIDTLFNWIFWLTTVIFVLVEGVLLVFLVKYRYRPEKRKGHFTHGNTRLEMTWTLAPAVILLIIALATKRVWDNYRFSPMRLDENRAQILVVGEQFKWNFVFPGTDQKLGKYMVFPQPTDKKYITMPREEAMKAISTDIAANTLGQYLDPKNAAGDPGTDDDYSRTPGRPLVIPAFRPIDLNLSSKDVLHDFFLPEFRVKLDAVPGMRGHIVFQSRFQSTKRMPIDQVPVDKWVWLDTTSPNTPGVEMSVARPRRYQIFDPTDKTRTVRSRVLLSNFESLADAATKRLQRTGVSLEDIQKNPQRLNEEVEKFRGDLKKAGVTELSVVDRKFEVVCEELCGGGHSTMRGEMVVVSNEEYLDFLKLGAPGARPTPAPRPATQPVAEAR